MTDVDLVFFLILFCSLVYSHLREKFLYFSTSFINFSLPTLLFLRTGFFVRINKIIFMVTLIESGHSILYIRGCVLKFLATRKEVKIKSKIKILLVQFLIVLELCLGFLRYRTTLRFDFLHSCIHKCRKSKRSVVQCLCQTYVKEESKVYKFWSKKR